MSDTIYIEPDLSYLEDRLDALGDFVGAAHSEIHAVGRSVDDLRGDVETLTQDFHAYAAKQEQTNRIQLAEIRLVKLRQEIEHRFGHYAEIRRMARGILEANDLAVVRQDTLRAAAEELMLHAPGYCWHRRSLRSRRGSATRRRLQTAHARRHCTAMMRERRSFLHSSAAVLDEKRRACTGCSATLPDWMVGRSTARRPSSLMPMCQASLAAMRTGSSAAGSTAGSIGSAGYIALPLRRKNAGMRR